LGIYLVYILMLFGYTVIISYEFDFCIGIKTCVDYARKFLDTTHFAFVIFCTMLKLVTSDFNQTVLPHAVCFVTFLFNS
jgi:hypothetical protein